MSDSRFMVLSDEKFRKCVDIGINFQCVEKNTEQVLQRSYENLSYFGRTAKPVVK